MLHHPAHVTTYTRRHVDHPVHTYRYQKSVVGDDEYQVQACSQEQ